VGTDEGDLGLAQDVCRALDSHVSHNGGIPWPAVKCAFGAWQAHRAEETGDGVDK
jgi:hypothetical protein